MRRTLVFLLFALALALRPAAAARLEPGQPLTSAFVAQLVETELDRADGANRFEIDIDQPSLPLVNQASRAAAVTLLDFRREARSGRFTARLDVRLESGEASTIALLGRARPMVAVPVPTRRIERGELITAGDVTTRWLPESLVSADGVRESADLVGQEAQRILAAGRVVRTADLDLPRLVQRGEPVTMIYASDGLELSTIGEALDAGGEGDVVRVLNPQGNQVRKGTVAGRRLVRVMGAGSGGP